jgi:ribonuclease D
MGAPAVAYRIQRYRPAACLENRVSPTFTWIDCPDDLPPLLAAVETAEQVVLDTEADSFHHYFEKICLLQFAVDGRIWLLDPLAGLDLTALLARLADRPLLLHGADYDLRMLRTSFGFRPRRELFDTVIAAQYVGLAQVGLAALVERYCGTKLCKDDQRSDWSRRPLTLEQLHYAGEDVRYLPAIAAALIAELDRLGRREWHRQACAALVEATGTDRERDPDAAWRIKGASALGPREQAFLRELWQWRDAEARAVDRPAFMILANAQLVEWAVACAGAPVSVRLPLRVLPRHIKGARLAALQQAIAEARSRSPEEYPQQPRGERLRPDPRQVAALNDLRQAVATLARELALDAPLLAPRAALQELVTHRPTTLADIQACGQLLPWQAELLLPAVHRTWQAHPL